MKILHISDTHTYHELLEIPKNIDLIIHSGDFSNQRSVYLNEPEALNFLHWYGNLDIKYKILVAGNHDAYAFTVSRKFKKWCKHYNIIYLENDYITIEDIKIFGSPYTPTFNDWYFMKSRDKMDRLWKLVNDDVDIFITHGPPKGILDLSENRFRILEMCGCNALRRHILQRIQPKLCLFGHIHNSKDIINAGTLKLSNYPTIFSNASVLTDGQFEKGLTSNGNILEI